jgi:hypothetical protein
MKCFVQGVRCGVLIAFFVFGMTVSAYAFILPARQILSFMIDQFGSGRSLVVFQKTVLYDPDLEGGMQELDETLYYGYPSQFRSEASTSGLEKIRVVNVEGAVVVLDGRIIGETEAPFDRFKDLMLYRDTDLLADSLSQMGINLDIVSFGRFRDKIAYVIGARYPDESVSQIWVDKQTFSPIRFVLVGDGDAPLREIEYTDYRSLDKDKRYPSRILFYENGTLVRMQVLENFEVNPPLPDRLFDVAHLKSVYEPLDFTSSTPSTPSEMDEVKKTIRDFRRIYE